jgi:hemolysin activation/secretion protein
VRYRTLALLRRYVRQRTVRIPVPSNNSDRAASSNGGISISRTFLIDREGNDMKKSALALAVLMAFGHGAFAQVILPPGGGAQIQQIPPAPMLERRIPDIRIEPRDAPATPASDQARITVKSLHVTGQTLYGESELLAATGFSGAGEMSLADLRLMAARIAEFYHQNGYFVAQAYLPAQDIKDGDVTIAVIEGRYGNITLRNQSKLSDSLANGLLKGLNSGDPVAIVPLENRLLLLSDVPGVIVRSTLVPGASVGASDLIVDVTPGRTVTGSVEADNAGSRYTGEIRLGATVNLNNLAGQGDVLSFRGLTSGSGLNYGRLSYQMQFGKATVGVAYTALDYRLGKEFAALQAHGTAEIASIYGSYPLIRSRNTNMYALLAFDAKTFQDRVDSTSSVTDKKARVLMASLNGNHRDRLGGGGVNSGSLTWTTGEIDIITPGALAADAATSRTNGHFDKLSYYAARLQSVTERFSVYGAVRGQLASKNLDISEKMGLGGMYGVRAYPVGESYADEGYIATVEGRYLLSPFSDRQVGQVHLVGFVDAGTVTLNKNPWTNIDNRRTLSGAGVGVTWADYNNFVVNAYYAWKLGNEVANSAPDRNGRFWIQLVKYF